MKMHKKQLKIVMFFIVIVLIIILIVTFLYVDKGVFLNKIIGKNNIAKEQENASKQRNSEVDISKWDSNKVNIVYDVDNIPVPVPKGFVVSSVENGVTPIGEVISEENRVKTGLVIYEMTSEEIENKIEVKITKDNFWEESQKRNQFVWVPVTDISRIYETDLMTGKKKAKLWEFTTEGRTIYNNENNEPGVVTDYDNEKYFAINRMQGMGKEKLLEELEKEFEITIESIRKYGGFYIGRYETGNISLELPIVKRMNRDIYNQKWYGMYLKMKKISDNENIQTDMIWGCLWDETLQWLIDTETLRNEEIVDSSSIANYKNEEFDYITTKGTLETKNNNGAIVPTGCTERNKANNIYDMAGNQSEWTLEVYNSSLRTTRGGSYNNNGVGMSYRNGCTPHFNGFIPSVGFRAYFYIK